jgi:hypothetical protein
MGYHTEFEGRLRITPKLKPSHLKYLQKFNEIRHVVRDAKKLETVADPLREAVGLPVGDDGMFYVGGKSWFDRGEEKDESIINYNARTPKLPGSYCQWRPSDDGGSISWDGMERFYHYVEWLQFLIDTFFKPWGYVIDGQIHWRGEELFDIGSIVVMGNAIELFGDLYVSESDGSARRLRVFLCHSNDDKQPVRELFCKLRADLIEPWLDEQDLIPGQDWEREIKRAVQETDLFIVCLSKNAVDKVGFVQKEIKYALDIADLHPEGRIFIIPLKLEECEVPDRLKRWHWVNYFEEDGYFKLRCAMAKRAEEVSK